MLRLAAACLAFASLFAAAAQAESYSDPEGRFSVDVPKDWQAAKPNSAPIALIMAGAHGKDMIGVCAVMVLPSPETKSKTQAEIDAALAAEINDDFWKNSLKAIGAPGVTIESSGAREAAGGRRVYFVVINTEETNKEGKVERMKGKQEVHAVPGSVHTIVCVTDTDKYEAASADFEAVFASYEPRRGLVAQAPAAPHSVLTFFAGTDFTGAARVLAQDTPNVPALAMSGPTASLSIAGFGEWEACEGLNFTGACRRLSAAETAHAGEALRIGSVRRVAPAGTRGALGVISPAVGLTLKAAVDRARAH